MAKQLTTKDGAFVFDIINDVDQQKLFSELADTVQISALNSAMRKAGKIILNQAKTNFLAIKKDKSKTGYADFDKAFKIKAQRSVVGVIVGMQHRAGYKYRFLNYGTADRQYKISHSIFSGHRGKAGFYKTSKSLHETGKINPSNFFNDAVDSTASTVQSTLSDNIVLSLEGVVKKYENNK